MSTFLFCKRDELKTEAIEENLGYKVRARRGSKRRLRIGESMHEHGTRDVLVSSEGPVASAKYGVPPSAIHNPFLINKQHLEPSVPCFDTVDLGLVCSPVVRCLRHHKPQHRHE